MYENDLTLVLEEVKQLLLRKHRSYGVDNLKKHGLYGIMIRMDDKLARLSNILTEEISGTKVDLEDETLRDTIKDIAGYALQAMLLIDKKL